MGRELRMVRPDWNHPRDEDGHYIPLHDGFNKDLADWNEGNAKWCEGLYPEYTVDGDKWVKRTKKNSHGCASYADYAGDQPKSDDYMPDWPASERTHFMMYENTSEGTPISPAFATAKELAHWLADTGASAFADMGATYEQWLATIHAGSAPSAVFVPGERELRSGVSAMEERPARLDALSKGSE